MNERSGLKNIAKKVVRNLYFRATFVIYRCEAMGPPIKDSVMRKMVKDFTMGMLVWFCIIWLCAFDPNQLGHWFKIAVCIGGATWFWWWICGYENPFRGSEERA